MYVKNGIIWCDIRGDILFPNNRMSVGVLDNVIIMIELLFFSVFVINVDELDYRCCGNGCCNF